MLPNFNIEYEDDTITNDDNNEMINNDSDNESIKSNIGTIGDNESIKSNTDTIDDNESIKSNTDTIDDNESINTSSSYNNENFFDIAIPPELHQHSEHLNVSRPVDVYSLIGKTFKYIEFNSTYNIVNKVRECKIVEDGENSVKFVLS